MGKLELNKKKKNDALFNTAFELFTTKGLTKTTISDIVNQAGVAKGTFYLYFKDKYDIRNKLVSHKTGELFFRAHEALQDAHITQFDEQVHFIVDFILTALIRTALFCFLFRRILPGVYLRVLLKRRCRMTNTISISHIWICWLRMGFIIRIRSCFYLQLLNW